jgi:osmoprotectant transport system permease protein
VIDLAVHARDHLVLSLSALVVAIAVGVALGAWIARGGAARSAGLGAVSAARVIPSLAVLALMIPLVGVGFLPALIALVLLAIPPIAINTDLGLRSTPVAVLDAALGMGMDARQIGRRVRWPLAVPIVFAGVRTAAVEVVASATLAAFIGGGGLGELIVNGLANNDTAALVQGAAAVGVLALAVDAILGAVERRLRRRWGTLSA